MTKQFIEPKLIKGELIEELDSLVGHLKNLSAYKPKPLHIQEAAMHARMSDFLDLAEQDYIKGWTDCEEGIRHAKGKPEAYNAGYADCYDYENKGGI